MGTRLSDIYGDVPVGDISVIHPANATGYFNFTVPANGSKNIRHEIMTAGIFGSGGADATITKDEWMNLQTPIFNWHIRAGDFDLTLEIQTADTVDFAGILNNPTTFKTFLIKVNSVHRMDSLYVPASNVLFILHNSSAVATCRVEGFIKMRSM